MLDKKIDSLQHLIHDVMRLHHYRTHMFLNTIGLYPSQPQLIMVLTNNDGQSQKEIAKMLHMKSSTLTIMIKRMEKVNLVIRKQDLNDKRISRVYLTDHGKELKNKIVDLQSNIAQESFESFTTSEKDNLFLLLTKIKDNLANKVDNKIEYK